jgi:serine/threonine-protein phosphatase 2A catalytic subunit
MQGQLTRVACPAGVASAARCGNKAALVDIDEHMQHKIVQFDHAPPKGAGITEVKRTVPDYFL